MYVGLPGPVLPPPLPANGAAENVNVFFAGLVKHSSDDVPVIRHSLVADRALAAVIRGGRIAVRTPEDVGEVVSRPRCRAGSLPAGENDTVHGLASAKHRPAERAGFQDLKAVSGFVGHAVRKLSVP